MIINTHGLELVRDEYMKRELDIINKMYPKCENIKDKYILFVQGELFFPYFSESIQANVKFIYENDTKTYKTKLRTPYPNKKITTISMINGRKVCNYGIPVLFDSYSDLVELKRILIEWKIDLIDNIGESEIVYVNVIYDVRFNCIKDKRVYGIFSKDCSTYNYGNEEDENKYFNQFEKITVVEKFGKDIINIEHLKGNELFEDFIGEGEENLYSTTCIYYSDEILEPDTMATNLPHI